MEETLSKPAVMTVCMKGNMTLTLREMNEKFEDI